MSKNLEALAAQSKHGHYAVHPAAESFPAMPEEGFDALVESIRSNGLRDPIILFNGQILDGRNRLRACQKAGVVPRFRDADPNENPWKFAWDVNGNRRDLEATQKGAIRLLVLAGSEKWEADRTKAHDEANERRSKAAKGNRNAEKKQAKLEYSAVQRCTAPGKDQRLETRETQPHSAGSRETRSDGTPVQRTRNVLAREAGISPRSAATVLALESKAPDKLAAVAAGAITAQQAVKAIKEEKKLAVVEAIKKEPVPLPTVGPFRVIVIDPSRRGRNGQGGWLWPRSIMEQNFAFQPERV